MSQAHIPQPDSRSAAPAEVFDSTAIAPHGPSVSGIGSGDPSSTEAPVHSGQKNTIDISVERQFMPIDNFFWTVQMKPGHLIWYTPIHPSRCNTIVNYLTGIYNTWAGGLEYNFKIAGTGFHAGALAFVRIPPNRHPTDFKSPAEWGVFEYMIIDPKTLEIITLDLMDQRRLHFHFMQMDEKDPDTFGGYIACYVLMELNTSSTGTQQISVQALCRPGPQFTLNQLVPPTGSIGPAPNVFPEALLDAMTPQYGDIGFRTKMGLELIVSEPKSLQKIQIIHQMGLNSKPALEQDIMGKHMRDGKNIFAADAWNSAEAFAWFPTCSARTAYVDSKSTEASVVRYMLDNQKMGWWGGIPGSKTWKMSLKYYKSAVLRLATQFVKVETVDRGGFLVSSMEVTDESKDAGLNAMESIALSVEPNDQWILPPDAQEGKDVWTIPASGEVVIRYATKAVYQKFRVKEAQTEAVVRALLKYDLTNAVPQGMAVHLGMYNHKTHVPLGQVKMYRNGVMTMGDQHADQIFEDVAFNYVGLIPERNSIRSSGKEVMNSMMGSYTHQMKNLISSQQ